MREEEVAEFLGRGALEEHVRQAVLPAETDAGVVEGAVRITLPFKEDDPLADLCQVRHADVAPLRCGPHVDQHGVGVRLQLGIRLRRSDVPGVAHG